MTNLTIIIPHYNSINSLSKLLDTIPSVNDIQIIIIDDKSENKVKSKLVALSKRASATLLFNNTEKKGAGVCRNIGIENAKGKWILFADSDDLFVEGFYTNILYYFNSNNDVVFFPPTSIDLSDGEISDRHINKSKYMKNYLTNRTLENETYLRYFIVVPWSKLIRKEFIKKNFLYFDEIIASNDVMFSTKVGYYMKVFEVSTKIIYCVTKSKGTLTTNISEAVYISRLDTFIKQTNFLKKNLRDDELKYISFSGRTMIVNAIKYKLPIKTIFATIKKLHENNIEIFNWQLLNPVKLTNKIKKVLNSYKKEKNYFD
ncbi:glycosyltransferase [Tetragenococcus halophilus]|uniref:glycosyltransferase n=1 Tax=Tetragenococcus halophilus TaxID=51669 RepID=UPI001F405479|nr:glycosyltransferase [Tetragenococcus halophilus]MCF1685053.1 glycosyltransferase [Tetragenococcus halophilus]